MNNNDKILEKTIISSKLTSNKILFIISAYAKKGKQIDFIIELKNLFQQLDLGNAKNYYVIAGDLSAKHTNWANNNNNERNITFKNWLQDNDIDYKINLYHTNIPSYPRSNSFIDLVLADLRLKINNEIYNTGCFI